MSQRPEARVLCEAAARGEPGAHAVLADYLAERGWRGFRLRPDPGDLLRDLLSRGRLPDRSLHELACAFAESVLSEYERPAPRDFRPRKALTAKRRWLESPDGPGVAAELNDHRAACARAEHRCPVQRYGAAAKAAAGAATHAASTGDIRESVWNAANRAAAAMAHAGQRRGEWPDDSDFETAWRESCRALLQLVADELDRLGL